MHGVGDAVARLHLRHPRADGVDDPRPFHAGDEGGGNRVQAGAVVDVDVVDAGHLDGDPGLAGTGSRSGHVRDLAALRGLPERRCEWLSSASSFQFESGEVIRGGEAEPFTRPSGRAAGPVAGPP